MCTGWRDWRMLTEPALIWLLEVGRQACPALLLGGLSLYLILSIHILLLLLFRLSSSCLPTVSL